MIRLRRQESSSSACSTSSAGPSHAFLAHQTLQRCGTRLLWGRSSLQPCTSSWKMQLQALGLGLQAQECFPLQAKAQQCRYNISLSPSYLRRRVDQDYYSGTVIGSSLSTSGIQRHCILFNLLICFPPNSSSHGSDLGQTFVISYGSCTGCVVTRRGGRLLLGG